MYGFSRQARSVRLRSGHRRSPKADAAAMMPEVVLRAPPPLPQGVFRDMSGPMGVRM